MSITQKKINLVLERCTYHTNGSELISDGHRAIIQNAEGGDEARANIVREYNDLVVLVLVAQEKDALLRVRHEHARAQRLNVVHKVAQLLILALPQQLLLAEVVEAQVAAHAKG